MPSAADGYEAYDASGLNAYRTAEGSDPQYARNYRDLLPSASDVPVLDLGCGSGSFLAWLRDEGYSNARGVDLSAAAVNACRQRGLANVDRIDDLGAYLRDHPGPFALVAMNDVIEHVPRDELIELLTLIGAMLAPGGTLVVKTLNMANPGGRYLRYADFTHTSGFTETSLRQVLVAARFGSVDVRRYEPTVNSAVGRVWLAAGRAWEQILRMFLLLDVGADRPSIASKLILAVARKPRPER